MTQDKNQGSENLNWMEIADADAINEPRHTGQRLPFIAAAVSLLIIGGGAVFAQTSNEAPTQAEETSVMPSPTATTSSIPSAVTPGGVPMIPNVAPGVGTYEDDDEYEDDDDEYEDDDDEYEEDDEEDDEDEDDD
jgi:hypothetical protein